MGEDLSNESITVAVQDAVRLNVQAMALSVYVGSKYENQTITNLAKLVNEGERLGIPVLAVTAVGKDMVRDARYLSLACRIAAEIGAHILAHWNLPAEVISAVRWHHDPDSSDTCELQMDVVYLANLLCQTSETSGAAGGNAIELSPAVIDRLEVQLDQFETISGKVAQWVDELSDAPAFN